MKKHERALFKSESKNERKLMGVIDFETDGLGGDFIEGAFTVEGEDTVYFSQDIGELVKILFSKKYRSVVWYGHNLAEYDLKYVIQYVKENRPDITISTAIRGSRITYTKLTKHKNVVELRDSLHLIQDSLKNIAKKFGAAEEKGFIDFSKEKYNPNNPEHKDYLRRDVVVLLDVLIKLDSIIFEKFGIHLKRTMSSTALACFKSTLKEGEIHWRLTKKVESWIREKAYFGGMVFARERRILQDLTHIDVNAMYASVMREYGVPCGSATYTHHEVEGYRGFYLCDVVAPKSLLFTFVPYRTTQGGCAYPTGHFQTVIDSDTIEFARQCGYVINIVEGYVFERIEHIFDDFINYCEQAEIPNKKNPLGESIKLVRNSCYGIFGLKPIGTQIIASQDDLGMGYNLVFDDQTNELLFGWYEEKHDIEAGYIQPHWASWITAHARLTLAKLVYAIGPESCFYGDTDSLVIATTAYDKALEAGIFSIGMQYGQMKKEAHYVEFISYGPKNYWGIDDNGIEKGKAKGVPKSKYDSNRQYQAWKGRHFDDKGKLRAGETEQYTSLVSTVRMLKSIVPSLVVHLERAYSLLENSSSWVVDEFEIIRPIHIEKALAA